MEQWFAPVEPSPPPAASSVLVLAPHPDDEIFGCAGLLALYRQQGTKIHVQVITDGAGYHRMPEREQVVETRKAETNQALALMGLSSAEFLGYPDRGLVRCTALRRVILDGIQSHRADVVLVPSLWEIHPDHLAIAHAALGSAVELSNTGGRVPILMFYEVGAPQHIDSLIDITSVWSAKHEAMQVFVSQNAVQNYARHIEALNTYRTYTLAPSVQFAEGYCVIHPQALADLIAKGGELSDRVMDRWTESALSAATAHAEALQAGMVAAQQNSGALLHRLGVLEQKLLQMEVQSAQLSEALAASQGERQQLLSSTSWRITAPLRRLMRFLRQDP